MGDASSIAAKLTTMFSRATFKWSTSGIEKLAKIDRKKVEIPAIVREMLSSQPRFYCGSARRGRSRLTFNLGSGEIMTKIWVTISASEAMCMKILESIESESWTSLSPETLIFHEVASGEPLPAADGATLYISRNAETAN